MVFVAKAKPLTIGQFTEHEPWCPICRRGKMLLRTNRSKGTTFYGCSNYPSCEWTEDDPESPDVDEDYEGADAFRWDRND